jgi:hypothetical protein
VNIYLDGALIVERPHPDDFCRQPSYRRKGPYRPVLDYSCQAPPVVSIAGLAYCAEHGEKQLAHSLFEALERALLERVPARKAV